MNQEDLPEGYDWLELELTEETWEWLRETAQAEGKTVDQLADEILLTQMRLKQLGIPPIVVGEVVWLPVYRPDADCVHLIALQPIKQKPETIHMPD